MSPVLYNAVQYYQCSSLTQKWPRQSWGLFGLKFATDHEIHRLAWMPDSPAKNPKHKVKMALSTS